MKIPNGNGMVGRTGPWMRQVVGIWDRSQRKGVILEANMGRPITNRDFVTIENSHFAAARLQLGEFLELQARRAGEACRLRVWCLSLIHI